ncbi:MAG TPA: hypothetical protein VIB47_11540 [Dehalococcoidia bacterium]|jgi:hypothetical protein
MAASPAADARARRFYEKALTEAERADFQIALEIEGVAEEAALLRLRLRQAVSERPEDLALMVRGLDALSRALSRRYRLGKQEGAAAAEAMRRVLMEFRRREGEDAAKEAASG